MDLSSCYSEPTPPTCLIPPTYMPSPVFPIRSDFNLSVDPVVSVLPVPFPPPARISPAFSIFIPWRSSLPDAE